MESRTIVVSLLIGVVVTAALLAGAGAALDPGAADRRSARLHAAAQPAPAARRSSRSRCCLGSVGLAMVLIGLFGSASAGTAAGLIGGGAVVIVFAVSLFSPHLVPPLARDRRLAAGAPASPARSPLARERPAQPEPHRRHRGGADDRPDGRHLRHRLRRRPEELGRPGRRRKLRRRPGDPEQRRLLADPRRRRGGRAARCPGWSAVATIRSAEQAKLVDGGGGAEVSAPTPRHRRDGQHRMEEGGPAVLRRLRDDQAILSDSFASDHDLEVGDRFRLLGQTAAGRASKSSASSTPSSASSAAF